MESRWDDMQKRRKISTIQDSIDEKCHLFSLPPELLGLIIDQMGSMGCLPRDTVDRQRDFLHFVQSHTSIRDFIQSDGHAKSRGHLIVYNPAEFLTTMQSALNASYRLNAHPGEIRSFSWVTRISVISADADYDAKYLYNALTTKEDFTDKLQRTLESMKRSLHLNANDATELKPVLRNLKSVAFVPNFHVHTSGIEYARFERERSKYSDDRKRQNQWIPDLSQQMQRFSARNDAGYCVRKNQHADQLPRESNRGSRLAHHMGSLYEADLDLKDKTGSLTWYVELTEGCYRQEDDAATRLAFLDTVAESFPASDGPTSLSIYLPHLMGFETEAEQKEYLASSQARMLGILAAKGASTTTAHECPNCLGKDRRY